MQKKMFGRLEVVFDSVYLFAALLIAVYYFFLSPATYALPFGVMTLVLVFGDAFHLIPRIMSVLRNDSARYQAELERGKVITSIGMTIFYVILWHIGLAASGWQDAGVFTAMVYLLAAVRILLSLVKQVGSIVRNIPFFFLGAVVCVLFYSIRAGSGFPLMWFAILLSFVFYTPVVCFAAGHPKVGMLMLPKSCVYLWMLTMGFWV